ncbi:MAG: hypothetical protein KKA07_06450, partial [Bacteroidetes bacterium]|nr:hypothetical protein [Bacteroidota bacterium]
IGLDCAEEVEENECDQIGDVLISRIIDKHMARLDATCLKILTLFFSRHRLAEISEETGVGMNYIKLKKHICQRKLIEMVRKDPYIKELLE